jgi:hypothetical protein
MKRAILMCKRIARFSGIVAVLAATVFAIPSTVMVSPVQAETVTSGTCTSTVDSAIGITMAVASNGDCVLSFATAATTPTTSTEFATRTWTVPASVTTVQALVVAGGGGGGSSNGCCFDAGAGGGGGVVVASSYAVTAGQSITVKTGLGGRGTYCGNGLDGGNSQFGALVAIGGGRGGGCSVIAGTGGSGGGAHCYVAGGVSNQATAPGTQSNGTTITAYGRAGGVSTQCSTGGGGGGGGATEVGGAGVGNGSTGPNGGVGGKGGEGIANSMRTDSAIVYGSGGGGQGRWLNAAGGTNGGSGSGTNASGGAGIDGVDETGSGGGAGWRGGAVGQAAGDGGSGIVVIRYSIPAPPSNLTAPVVTGTARTGETLTTSNGSWTGVPTSYAYQWKRSATSNGVYSDLAASTSSTYVVTEFDVGYFIKAFVTATNGLGASTAASSVATASVVDIAPTNTVLPVITGTARTGATLTTSNGTWTSSPSSYAYQWKRASTVGGTYTNIASATNRTYELTDTDIDKFIKVSVIATNIIGASSAALSTATAVVVDLTDSVVPTATTPVSTATGFTFTISNYSANYTYALTTTKGTVSRLTDDVTVTGLSAGESATVTIAVTRSAYKPASKAVTGSATAALTIVIQAPVTTVAQGQASVATVAPTTTTLPVLGANGIPVPTTTTTTITTTTTVAPARSRIAIPTTTLPRVVTTTTLGPPVAGKVDAGQTAVQVDGVKTDATVTRENNQMVVNAGALSATLSGLDKAGKTTALDSDGNIHLAGGDVIKISVGGFKAGTLVEVWLFSTPTKLGSVVVGADGTVTGAYKLPFGIKSGSHRVVVTARTANGKSTTFTLGILVGNISKTSTLTRVLIAIPISLAIGFGFLLPTQLRRRRKTRIA